MRTRQKRLFFKQKVSVSLCVLSEGGLQCNASVSGLSLLGGLHWLSIRQSLCVSQSSVNACGLPKRSASSLISASPSSAEASESRSKHDWMHRVGSRRRLVLETACSDPPTDAQQRPCTFLYNFCGHSGGVAAGSHGSTWVGVAYRTYPRCALWIRSERDTLPVATQRSRNPCVIL